LPVSSFEVALRTLEMRLDGQAFLRLLQRVRCF